MDNTTELILAAVIGATGLYWAIVLSFTIRSRLLRVKMPTHPLFITSVLAGFGIILILLVNPFGKPVIFAGTYGITVVANGLVHMLLRKNT